MTVTIKLISSRMRATLSTDRKFVKTYSDKYLVTEDTTGTMTEDLIAAAIGIVPGAPHPNWPAALCGSISIDRKMTRAPHRAWEASYEYSTETPTPSNPSSPGSTDPMDFRVKRTVGFQERQRYTMKDRLGNMIVDGAGSPFDGGIPVTDFLGQLSWERNELHTSSKMYQSALLTGLLNSTTFMTCPPYTLILKVTGSEKYEGGYHYWSFKYDMNYDPNGWQPKPLNAGLYQRGATAGTRQRIKIANDDAQEPQPLYAADDVIESRRGKMIPFDLRPAQCNFLTVDHYNSIDFATLGLPTT